MKNNNLVKIVVIIAGVAYVYKVSKSKGGLLAGLGITPHSLLGSALPFLGIRNPIVSTIISEGAKRVFPGTMDDSVIEAQYKRIK